MKRFVVVGLGSFGSFVARKLYELGHDVIAIDLRDEAVDAIGPAVSRAMVGDGTKRAVLDEIGAAHADAAIVSTGTNLGASVLAQLALRDLGVEAIYVKVHSEEHARIADALGATENIFPEREVAESLASRLTSSKLLRYVQYAREFGIQEMAVPDAWYGKTLRDLQLPTRYKIQVVAVHDFLRDTITIPDPDKPLTQSETLLIAGDPGALERVTRLR